MIIVGIDLSLTGTGVATYNSEHPELANVKTIGSRGKADDNLGQRWARLDHLVDALVGMTVMADLVVIEQPAYNQTNGKHHDRSGAWWLLVDRIVDLGVADVAEVSPTAVKRYATGKGNAAKTAVMAAGIRRFGDTFEIENDNEGDAVWLCAMGAHHRDHPIGDTTALQREVLQKVVWP